MLLPSLADQFPFEIYESIIGFVAEQDNISMSSIKSCALTSHNFLLLARNHLFSHIWLDEREIRTQSFVRLILQTPEIAQHVRSLRCHVKPSDFAIENLVDALKTLTRLRSLIIGLAESEIHQNLDWSGLPLPLQVELLHRPTLTRLTLAHIRNLHLSDLAVCSSLNYLSIEDVTLASTVVHRQTKALQLKEYTSMLDENDITNQLNIARSVDGTYIIDFSTLQTVKLNIQAYINKILQGTYQMLFKCCTQVTRVAAVVDEGEHTFLKPLILQGFTNMILPSLRTLQYLEFVLFVTKLEDCGLAAELEAIPGDNVIENIQIQVLSSSHYGRGDEWVALDSALTRDPSKWRNLKTVSLKFFLNEWAVDVRKVLVTLPRNQLKGLLASKVIHFVYEVISC